MQFNTWNHEPFKSDVANSDHFIQGLLLGLNTFLIIWLLRQMLGCCADPLAERLQEKVRTLEDENDNLINQVDELKIEYNTLSNTLRRANASLENLRDVLNINRPVVNDVIPDTQG